LKVLLKAAVDGGWPPPMGDHDVTALTAAQLEVACRELAASLARRAPRSSSP
jgi:hypothetical protein